MKRIRISALAERDLDEIWYYIARNSSSIETANGIIDSITDAFLSLHEPLEPEPGAMRLRKG